MLTRSRVRERRCGLVQRRAGLDQPAALLVDVVEVARQHADERAPLPVQDREGVVAAALEQARLVVAVAPRDVLQRVVADRRPEAGRLRPRVVVVGGDVARDLAHALGLAPVLHDQTAPAVAFQA